MRPRRTVAGLGEFARNQQLAVRLPCEGVDDAGSQAARTVWSLQPQIGQDLRTLRPGSARKSQHKRHQHDDAAQSAQSGDKSFLDHFSCQSIAVVAWPVRP